MSLSPPASACPVPSSDGSSPTASSSVPSSNGSNAGSGEQQQRRMKRHTGQRGGRGLHRPHSSLSIGRGPRRPSRVDRAGATAIHSSLTVGRGGAGGMPRVAGSGGIYSSMTPDCRVHHNSVRFDREESDWIDDSSYSHSDDGESMEVMDLRPRRRLHSCTDQSSSLVSFGSRSSLESEDKLNLSSSLKLSAKFIMNHGIIDGQEGMFPVASAAARAISGRGARSDRNKETSEGGNAVRRGDENGMPEHWAQPEASVAGPARDKKRGGRCLTQSLNQSRLSDLAPRNLGDAGNVSESESEGGNSMWTEASPPADDRVKGRARSTVYAQKCVRALTGFVVLVVFSSSVIVYLFPPEDRKWMLEFLLATHHLRTLLDRPQLVHREVSIPQQNRNDHLTKEMFFGRLDPETNHYHLLANHYREPHHQDYNPNMYPFVEGEVHKSPVPEDQIGHS